MKKKKNKQINMILLLFLNNKYPVINDASRENLTRMTFVEERANTCTAGKTVPKS